MKKTIIATLGTVGLAFGTFAQGSLTGINDIETQVASAGPNAQSLSSATTYYTGAVTLEIFYAPATSVSQSQINTINADNGTDQSAYDVMIADGFVLASGSSPDSTTTGAINGYIDQGGFEFSTTDASLPGAPTGATASQAWLAFYLVDPDGDSGIFAFANATGGTPTSGDPAAITGLDLVGANQSLNLVLSPVPEPGTVVLAGLGGFSLLLFRRKSVG
jgi:hypothetical protein